MHRTRLEVGFIAFENWCHRRGLCTDDLAQNPDVTAGTLAHFVQSNSGSVTSS